MWFDLYKYSCWSDPYTQPWPAHSPVSLLPSLTQTCIDLTRHVRLDVTLFWVLKKHPWRSVNFEMQLRIHNTVKITVFSTISCAAEAPNYMNQMKILHFSLFCQPGEFGHNEKSKTKMKTDQAIFFQACLLCLRAAVHKMTDWLQLLHPEVWRTPRDRRQTDDRDLFASSEWVKAIVALQSEVWFVLRQSVNHPHTCITTAAPHEDVWRYTHTFTTHPHINILTSANMHDQI